MREDNVLLRGYIASMEGAVDSSVSAVAATASSGVKAPLKRRILDDSDIVTPEHLNEAIVQVGYDTIASVVKVGAPEYGFYGDVKPDWLSRFMTLEREYSAMTKLYCDVFEDNYTLRRDLKQLRGSYDKLSAKCGIIQSKARPLEQKVCELEYVIRNGPVPTRSGI